MKNPSFALRREYEIHADIGRQIADAREARGLTLKRMARLTNLSISLLLQIERGEVCASISALLKIASALDLCLTTLLRGH